MQSNKNLLKQSLQKSGNVTVLMDGFDDVCPIHADKAAAILTESGERMGYVTYCGERETSKEVVCYRLEYEKYNT